MRGKIYHQIPDAIKKKEKNLLTSKQRWFILPFGDTGCAIRLNVVGREPNGLIKRGQEYDEICKFIRDSISTLKNLETGKPLVEEVIQINHFYHGEALEQLPDLVINWNREAPIKLIGSEELGQFEVKCYTRRTGEHNDNAIFWLNSSSLQPQELEANLKIEDLAPTIATLLGVELPETDGSPIQANLGN